VLGAAWAVIVPLLNMLIFTVIFHVLFGFGKDMKTADGQHLIPYAIFVYIALLPWQLFSNSLASGGMSLVNQQHLLTKIYFPRLFLPTAAVGALLVDMGISFCVLIALMVAYHFVPWVSVHARMDDCVFAAAGAADGGAGAGGGVHAFGRNGNVS